MLSKVIITIDGPAASGKGTVAKMLAERLGFDFLPTGNIYRAFAKYVHDNHIDPTIVTERDAENFLHNLTMDTLQEPELGSDEMARIASIIAKFQYVRDKMNIYQREFPYNSTKPGSVLEGRDIGSVIFPNANFKFYITASPEVRAKRRFEQFKQNGIAASYEQILNDIYKRDEQDKTRTAAPLTIPEGAVVVDTSELSVDEVFDRLYGVCSSGKF